MRVGSLSEKEGYVDPPGFVTRLEPKFICFVEEAAIKYDGSVLAIFDRGIPIPIVVDQFGDLF